MQKTRVFYAGFQFEFTTVLLCLTTMFTTLRAVERDSNLCFYPQAARLQLSALAVRPRFQTKKLNNGKYADR